MTERADAGRTDSQNRQKNNAYDAIAATLIDPGRPSNLARRKA
jgi:hypothetical protein